MKFSLTTKEEVQFNKPPSMKKKLIKKHNITDEYHTRPCITNNTFLMMVGRWNKESGIIDILCKALKVY